MKDVIPIAVCDDDASVLGVIAGATKNAFQTHDIRADVFSFASVSDLEAAMEGREFELLLLDIDLPEEDGIRLARRLQAKRTAPDIIFVSSREERMYDAFSVHPFGFVRKSNFLQDITEVAEAYIAAKAAEPSRFFVAQSHGQTLSLPIEEIAYFEGSRRDQMIYLRGESEPIPIRLSMKKLEAELAPLGFLRVHSGYLVNYRCIRRLAADGVRLGDGRTVPISRRRYSDIRLAYMDLAAEAEAYIF